MAPTCIAIAYYSQFKGATTALAEAIARGARSVPDTTVDILHVDQVDEHWPTLHAADAIIFGTPTYIGSAAAGFKVFMERLAGQAWLERLWMNKVAAGFTVSAGRSGGTA